MQRGSAAVVAIGVLIAAGIIAATYRSGLMILAALGVALALVVAAMKR